MFRLRPYPDILLSKGAGPKASSKERSSAVSKRVFVKQYCSVGLPSYFITGSATTIVTQDCDLISFGEYRNTVSKSASISLIDREFNFDG